MSKKTFGLVLLICTTFPLLVMADDNLEFYKKLTKSNFEQVTTSMQKHWLYKLNKKQAIDGEEEKSIEVFDPRKHPSKQWQLISFNGQPPSEEQLLDFVELKKEELNDRTQNSIIQNKFLSFIDMNTLKVENDNGRVVTLSFDAYNEKFGNAAKGKIDGLLTIDKQNKFVKNITLSNNSSFSVKLILNIKSWDMSFTFTQKEGAIVIIEQSSSMIGTAAFFKNIEVSTLVEYSEHTYVAAESTLSVLH